MAGERKLKRLGEICEFRGGQGFPQKHQGAIVGEYPFIKVSDMELPGNRHRITRANHWIDETTRKELRAKPHPATSTVFAKIGIALTYNRRRLLSRPTIVDNNMMAAVPIESEVEPLFLYYLLKATDFNEVVSGTALPFINGSDLAKMEVEVPPLAEQKAIAAVLGALDDKIELNRRMNATLEAMARALFQSWFVDFDPVRAKLDGRPPAALDPATAALFPASFQDSTAGHIPSGWRVMKVGEFIERLSVGQKYEQKTVSPVGKVPVLDQGKSGVIGFHNNEPGVTATLDKPVAVFANHTCYMRLITYSFSAIQNVLPFVGSGVDTFWAYYATEGRLSFSEYKGHWPDFVIQESVVPPRELTDAFGRLAKPLVAKMRNNEEESYI